jgi:hypothetical protein
MDRTRVARGRFWPLALLALWSLGGCASWQSQEPAFRDDTAKWGETNRPIKLGGGYGSLSAEGQQIERNLGVR